MSPYPLFWVGIPPPNNEHAMGPRGPDQQTDTKLISANVKGFVYEFAIGEKGKVSGVVLKTETMRYNL